VVDAAHAHNPLYFEYTIDGTTLEHVDRQRLLGVHLFLWAATSKGAPQGQKVNVPIQPLMTFGLPAWHPTTPTNIKKLEGMHQRGLHFIHGRHLPPPLDQKMMPMAMHLQQCFLLQGSVSSPGTISRPP
jgi:hypothetical protein